MLAHDKHFSAGCYESSFAHLSRYGIPTKPAPFVRVLARNENFCRVVCVTVPCADLEGGDVLDPRMRSM